MHMCHPQPHHSTHAWKQTQGPDAQHAEVSGVESLTSLTNRSLLQWPAHRPFLHTYTEWLISSLSTPPRPAAAQLTATFIMLGQLSLYYTLWAHGETNQDGFKIGQLWALAIFHVFTLRKHIAMTLRDEKLKRAETDCLSVLKLVWLWQRAVLQHTSCLSTLDLSLALTSASCLDGQSAPWTEALLAQLDLWGPIPTHKPRESTGKRLKGYRLSFVKRAFKTRGKHTSG